MNVQKITVNEKVNDLNFIEYALDLSVNDLNIGDSEGNVILKLADGQIQTKEFDSNHIVYDSKDDSNANLNIGDKEGNIVIQIKNGHIKTKYFDSSIAFNKRQIKILFVGNSITQDHAAYVPYILKNTYGDDISFKICIFYIGGWTVRQYVENVITGEHKADIFSTADNNDVWTSVNNTVTLENAIKLDNWDIISMQGYWWQSSTPSSEDMDYFPTLVNYFIQTAIAPFELAWLMHQDFNNKIEEIISGARRAIKENPVSMLFSPLFSTEYAKIYFANNQLTPDNCHMREGMPCMIGAYEIVFTLMKHYGLHQRVLNNPLRITAEKWQAMNIPGPNGTPDYSFTNTDYINCQKVAIAGYKTASALFDSVQSEMLNEIQN